MRDVNFDTLVGRFEKNIYESVKGQIRIRLLLEDLHRHVPELDRGSLHILDAGCGTGYLSSKLANTSHQFDLCDISAEMLDLAKTRFASLGEVKSAFHQVPIQGIQEHMNKACDLVMVHAVLEWLASPKEGLTSILGSVRPGGYLSLLFYNQYSLVYRHLIMGNYRRLNDRPLNGFGGTLTPINPLDPYEVENWLNDANMEIVCKTGIRTFYDYQTRQIKQERSFEDIYEMEARYARQQPFMYLGRYIHFLCFKPLS